MEKLKQLTLEQKAALAEFKAAMYRLKASGVLVLHQQEDCRLDFINGNNISVLKVSEFFNDDPQNNGFHDVTRQLNNKDSIVSDLVDWCYYETDESVLVKFKQE
jgi:hypothetical protein